MMAYINGVNKNDDIPYVIHCEGDINPENYKFKFFFTDSLSRTYNYQYKLDSTGRVNTVIING